MSAVSPADVVQQLQWRYATKKFDAARKIPDEVWDALEESLVLAPSSYGLQPWKFIVVTNQAVKEKLMAASWNQAQVRDASHVVVFARRNQLPAADVDRHLQRIVEVRGGSIDALQGLRKAIVGMLELPPHEFNVNDWASLQVYIALGQFMTAAAMMGVDTCPMEGIEAARYDEILNIAPLGYSTCVVATAGYRAADCKYASLAKVRYPRSEVVQHVE